MAKILLTGGAGYIGSHVNLALSETGHETVVFDNLSTGFRELVINSELIVGDLLDKTAIDNVLKDGGFDLIAHFAAKTFVGESVENPSKYWLNNVVGTRNLLDSMATYGPDKIVFSSSCSVYGEPIHTPIFEDHPLTPLNPYGKTKLVGEWMIEEEGAANGLKFGSLRYFNAVGADPEGRVGLLTPGHPQLLSVCLDTALGHRQCISVFGNDYPTPDGTGLRDFIHVSDLATAHVAAAEKLLGGAESFTLNLGVGRGFSVMEVIRAVEAKCGHSLLVKVVARREGDPAISIADSSAAFALLDWKPRLTNIDTIVETAYRWRTSNRDQDANPTR